MFQTSKTQNLLQFARKAPKKPIKASTDHRSFTCNNSNQVASFVLILLRVHVGRSIKGASFNLETSQNGFSGQDIRIIAVYPIVRPQLTSPRFNKHVLCNNAWPFISDVLPVVVCVHGICLRRKRWQTTVQFLTTVIRSDACQTTVRQAYCL